MMKMMMMMNDDDDGHEWHDDDDEAVLRACIIDYAGAGISHRSVLHVYNQ